MAKEIKPRMLVVVTAWCKCDYHGAYIDHIGEVVQESFPTPLELLFAAVLDVPTSGRRFWDVMFPPGEVATFDQRQLQPIDEPNADVDVDIKTTLPTDAPVTSP